MTTFDWIDFGYSWNEEWKTKILEKDFHSSTSSLLAQKLRGRAFGYEKIFLWMREAAGIETSSTKAVFHIESVFPFNKYETADDESKLRIFAEWMLSSIYSANPELLFNKSEIEVLLHEMDAAKYTYIREDKVPSPTGQRLGCRAMFVHTPYEVTARVACSRNKMECDLPAKIFRRDELDYGRSVTQAIVEDEWLNIETSKGVFKKPIE